MWTARNTVIYGVVIVAVFLLVPSGHYCGGQATPSGAEKATKLEDRIQQLEQRLAETNRNLVAVLKAFKEMQDQKKGKPPRWQMLNAGKKVIVLDTQMGESRTVEPEPAQRHQIVTVGNSVFIIDTVGGFVKEERKGSK
jgi:hypothetical protein